MRRLRALAFVFVLGPAAGANGQECPVVNGLFATVSTGDSTARRDTSSTLLRFDSRTVIDTTWRFDISERRWSKPYIVASVGAGWTGDAARAGTTTAPGTRAWSACASAAVGMRDPTIVLRGARGLVRLRADLTSLSQLRGGVRADSIQPRR